MPAGSTSLDLEGLVRLCEGIAAGVALDTTARLGVLARLEVGPVDAVTLARECTIGERGARLLLATLAGLGLVEALDDGTYRAAVPNLVHLAMLLAPWQGLDEAIRSDRPAVAGDSSAGAESYYPGVVPLLAIAFAPAAECAADWLASPGLRVLDVGAGAAPWSLALARRDPTCRVTAVDLPAVLQATRRAVEASGLDAQFTYLGGDCFAADLGSSAYDLATIGNLCHLFDETSNRRLLGRLFDVLRPGGKLAIIDVLPNERLDGPRSVVLYALGLLTRTRSGQVYPFSTYVTWLREAGYQAIDRCDLPGPLPSSLITAHRP